MCGADALLLRQGTENLCGTTLGAVDTQIVLQAVNVGVMPVLTRELCLGPRALSWRAGAVVIGAAGACPWAKGARLNPGSDPAGVCRYALAPCSGGGRGACVAVERCVAFDPAASAAAPFPLPKRCLVFEGLQQFLAAALGLAAAIGGNGH